MGAKEVILEHTNKFVLDSGANEEYEGQELHGQTCPWEATGQVC